MTGIFTGIQTLIDTILAPIKWLGFIIMEIYHFGELILATITTLMTNITTLPNFLLKYAILSISVIVLLRILGRSTK